MYLITSYDEAERYIGRKADKNRKIYNGMLRTYFYQFMGPKPPRRSVRDTAGGMNEIFKRYIVFGVLVAAMLIFKLEPGGIGERNGGKFPRSQSAGGNLEPVDRIQRK